MIFKEKKNNLFQKNNNAPKKVSSKENSSKEVILKEASSKEVSSKEGTSKGGTSKGGQSKEGSDIVVQHLRAAALKASVSEHYYIQGVPVLVCQTKLGDRDHRS